MMTTTTGDKISAIIVDDERLSIKGLEMLLVDYPQIDIVGTSHNIDGAVELINNYIPDLIFLDIQLQGETGFDLFERTSVKAKVVFVTAYDAYAIRAFEINALDYLMKPVNRQRFAITMDRINANDQDNQGLLTQLKYDDVVVLHTGRRMRFVKIDQILSISAEGDYTRVGLRGHSDELVYKSMKAWEAILPRDQFARVHRSTILNKEYIYKIEKTTSNRYLAYLSESLEPLPMSQRYSAGLRKRLANKVEKFRSS